MSQSDDLLRAALLSIKGEDFASQVSRGSLLAHGSRTESGRQVIADLRRDGLISQARPTDAERLDAVLALHQPIRLVAEACTPDSIEAPAECVFCPLPMLTIRTDDDGVVWHTHQPREIECALCCEDDAVRSPMTWPCPTYLAAGGTP